MKSDRTKLSLAESQRARRTAGYLNDVSPMYRGLVERALAGTASPRAAIRAKCLSCVGFVRADITNCTARTCELWSYRPYQSGEIDEEGEIAAEGVPERV